MGTRRKLQKRLFSAAVIASLTTAAIVAPQSPVEAAEVKSFPDVKKSDYFYEAVQQLNSKGIIRGYEDGKYYPNKVLTRGEAASIIATAIGLDTKNVKNPQFKDIKTQDWYYGAIAALVDRGVLSVNSTKTFGPQDPLTRAELAKILTKAFQLNEEVLIDSPFSDVGFDDWFSSYIQPLIKNNITKGTSIHHFSPNEQVTRGQMAAFVHRAQTIQTDRAYYLFGFEVKSAASSNNEVATVKVAASNEIMIQAVAKGRATITVIDASGQSKTINIIVDEQSKKLIIKDMRVQEMVQFSASLIGFEPAAVESSSSDVATAMITEEQGVEISAIGTGTSIITVTGPEDQIVKIEIKVVKETATNNLILQVLKIS